MIYQHYAAVYDGSGQVRYALLVAPYLHELLQRHQLAGRKVIDIACGTGTLALLLAAEGYEVLGVDGSPDMLARAEAKTANNDLPGRVAFIHGDMRSLSELVPPAIFDLATCTYDSLNYMLTEADLGACFVAAAHTLRPGGLYIADMNTRHFLEFEWGFCDVREQSGYVQVERSYFDPADTTTTLWLTGFVGDDHNGYQRFDEVHRERAYPTETVAGLLESAGLRVEGYYDSFTHDPPGPRCQRIFWVARKQ